MMDALLSRLRRRIFVRLIAYTLAATVLGFAVLSLLGLSPERSALLAGGLAIAGFMVLARRRLAGVDARALALHLDRQYPELEESATLLLKAPESLSALQNMQRDRAASRFEAEVADDAWLPRLQLGGAVLVMATGLLLAWLAPLIQAQIGNNEGQEIGSQAAPSEVQLSGVSVTITPPAYTGLASSQSTTLDLELMAGSLVEWQLELTVDRGEFALAWSDNDLLTLDARRQGVFSASKHIDVTGLYRLVQLQGDEQHPLGDIHTLSVQRDQAPDVRILDPTATALEIPLGGPATFSTSARVNDDFGIGRVELQASVGRGGGEGVKFRDQQVPFTHREETSDGMIFSRTWDLGEMGMEPGDEMYFFVSAQDNREPEANLARSRTVVVRWLDDEAPVAEFAGLAIDVMPDYFKSQRQIIIETEQLIADRDDLESSVFDDTSRGLAQAQSDLKQRYGQYLGDESEEGGAFEPPPAEADHDGEEDHEEDEEASSSTGMDAVGHDHGAEAANAADIDTTGSADQLIARFAHDHGASEIGPITSRNPVGMMKRALGNMWQAELHLHLSEPELALPFEYEALKYYNLARQADRVYTRRLGFEPPPVSEERRLSGDLEDIRDLTQRFDAQPDPVDASLFQAAYHLLSTRGGQAMQPSDVELLQSLGARFTTLSQQRPALIKQAATVERLLSAGEFRLPNCPDCIPGLLETTWSMLPAPDSDPSGSNRRRDPNDALPGDFLEQLDP